jgi:hypothetical protein
MTTAERFIVPLEVDVEPSPLAGPATERTTDLIRFSYETIPVFTGSVERSPLRFAGWGLCARLSESVRLSGTGKGKRNCWSDFARAAKPIRGLESVGRPQFLPKTRSFCGIME